MHKSLKKTLAVLLAVLMLAFSIPFNAFAYSPSGDEALGDLLIDNGHVDSGMQLHVYAMPYVDASTYGPTAVLDDDEENAEMVFFDLSNLTIDELSEYANAKVAEEPGFVLLFMLEGHNADIAADAYFSFKYDKNYIQPATLNKKGTAYTTTDSEPILKNKALDMTGCDADYLGQSWIYIPVGQNTLMSQDGVTEWDFGEEDDIAGAVLPGTLLAMFTFKLVQDSDLVNGTEFMTERKLSWTAILYKDADDQNYCGWYRGYGDDTHILSPTYFTCPELGIVAEESDDPVPSTVTYTYADGSIVTLDADADAPDNTADKLTSNEDGTHTTTTYSWVAADDDGEFFTEEATSTTAKCDYNKVVTAATSCAEGSGYTTYTCKDCGYVTVADYTSLEHDFSVKVSSTAGNCQTKGTTTYKCSYGCGTEDVVTGDYGDHVPAAEALVDSQAATRAEAGYEKYETKCTVCGEVLDSRTVVIPATGVQISVLGADLGTVTLNGAEVANEVVSVPVGSMYTLTATPADGVTFVGWEADGKLVSTDATYSTAAYADTTYEPVFALGTSDEFTVMFVDMYGNVITVLTNDAVAALAEMPVAPTYAGMVFTGWTAELADVQGATADTVVTALYEPDEATSFTITAAGAEITVDGETTTDTAVASYNSKVTVTAPNATSWTANGATVAYGDTYSFLCGSNVTLAFDTETAVAAPEVAIISADKSDTYKVKFLATRSIPDGYTLIESGFVYGKAMVEEDLVLDNVGTTQGTAGATVKQIKNSNMAADGQFALNYGVTAMDANASARAYAVVKNAAGEISVVYSSANIFKY